ncbi:GDSL esterase/lipase 4-like [Senna tora]|uniref:GDSL esterase/lipase 4-like n=1 Tax=Senna tora TaxID=362788 RepID=A0A834XJR3_9FABA|nr:GDSL esterase/lipase 4-like [Senna tora]
MLLSNSIYIFSLGASDLAEKPSKNYEDLGNTVDAIFKAYQQVVQFIINFLCCTENRDEACCGGVAANGELTCGNVINKDKVKVCANPNKYLWFDAIHPTDAANRQYTDQLWENKDYAKPHTLQDLVGNEILNIAKPPEATDGNINPYPKAGSFA